MKKMTMREMITAYCGTAVTLVASNALSRQTKMRKTPKLLRYSVSCLSSSVFLIGYSYSIVCEGL